MYLAEKISQSHGNPEIYKNKTRKNKNITTNKINQMPLYQGREGWGVWGGVWGMGRGVNPT